MLSFAVMFAIAICSFLYNVKYAAIVNQRQMTDKLLRIAKALSLYSYRPIFTASDAAQSVDWKDVSLK